MSLTKLAGSMVTANSITSSLIGDGQITQTKFSPTLSLGPKIASLSYASGSSTSTAGGETITLTGSNFTAGISIYVDQTVSSVVTVANTTQLTFTAPAKDAGTYAVYAIATNGSVAIHAPGILYA